MKPQRNRTRAIGFYVLIMVILLAVIYTMLTPQQPQEELTYSEIVDMFKEEQVESFVIEGSTLIITPKGAAETDPDITYDLYDVGLFISQLGSLIDEQHEAGIISEYDYKTGWVAPWWLSMIPYLLIIVAFFALWYYMMNKAGGGGGAPPRPRPAGPGTEGGRPCPPESGAVWRSWWSAGPFLCCWWR